MGYDIFILCLVMAIFIGLLLGCTALYAVAEKICNPHLTWKQIYKHL